MKSFIVVLLGIAQVTHAYFKVDFSPGSVSSSSSSSSYSSSSHSFTSSSHSSSATSYTSSSTSYFSKTVSGDGSGDDAMEIIRPVSLIKDISRCGADRAGHMCLYTKYPYTPYVPSSQWGRSRTSNKNTCTITGTGDTQNFDGGLSYLSTQCELLAFGICDDTEGLSVWTSRDRASSKVSKIRVKQGETEIVVSDTILVNGKEVTAPYSVKNFDISKENGYYIITYDNNAEISYDVLQSEATISVPNTYTTCGLCGNQNGDADDDLDGYSPAFVEKSDEHCMDAIWETPLSELETCTNLDSTHSVCNILISSAFGNCMPYVSPASYYKKCLRDVCRKNIESSADVLCAVGSSYARQCSRNYGHPGEWRALANCVTKCSDGMKWSECVDSSLTCAAYGSKETATSCGSYICKSGCQCMEGTYLQDGACVRPEKCNCEGDNGKWSEPGQTKDDGCNNTCTCYAGHWKCTNNPCPGVAQATGSFRYSTFDGRFYRFPDSCTHIFAEDVRGDFAVLVAFEEHDGMYYKYPIVKVKEGVRYHSYTLKRNGKIIKDDKPLSAPFKSGTIEIQKMVGNVLLTIKGKGVEVLYDHVASIAVKVPPEYASRMVGLAGNFNGKRSDDLREPSTAIARDISVFGDSWRSDKSCRARVFEIPSHDQCSSEAKKICSEMLKFKSCDNAIAAISDCVTDICKVSSLEMMTTHACSFKSGYYAACTARETFKFDLTAYHEGSCKLQCAEQYEYKESNQCIRSCSSFSNICTSEVYPGCFCPDGKFQDDRGNCVSKYECPCLYDGTWYETGPSIIGDKQCSCDAGVLTCTSINETTSCDDPNEQFYSCVTNESPGAACEKNCDNTNDVCMTGTCVTGCACKTGFYRSVDRKCVPKEECGCFNGDKYYKHGEYYMDECNNMTCYGGEFKSTGLVCSRTCWAVGASHYKSFDGLRYDFEGDCEYILATDYCPNNPNRGLFSVITSNYRCGSNGLACSKSIIISVKNQRIILQRGKEAIIEKIGGEKTRQRLSEIDTPAITGDTDHSVADTFTIKQKGIFTVIETCIGMTVLWDNGTRVYIRLTQEFQSTICGLCGNYDGSDENDLIKPTGLKTRNILDFGNSWKFTGQRAVCADTTFDMAVNSSCTDTTRKEWATKRCHTIIDREGPFAPCHSVVSPDNFFEICVNDACGCDSGGDCECLCTAIAHYAHTCSNKGVPVEWRSNDLCPIMCEQYNNDEDICLWHYRACATCITRSCCECLPATDRKWCVEGCFPNCPAGYILDEMTQKCVLESEKETQCTWFSRENMCHTCKKCDECKTPSGAVLRVKPGQTIYFPHDTDECIVEWCAVDTTGDLCYNGTAELYPCDDYPIPPYDPAYYIQNCWNSTTSACKNCRECENICKEREDSCESGKTPEDAPWRKVFPVIPAPEKGAQTYCMEYTCENHPDATDPQCFIQREERVACKQNIDDVICKDHEVLVIHPTGDECCPQEYECVCKVCTIMQDGAMVLMKDIQPNETQDWCEDSEESNCCYSDTCTEDVDRYDKTICPTVNRVQSPCTTGPAPTCAPGYVWVNKTRPADCCPWGECECDCCNDYNELNVKSIKLIGEKWTKKCMRFTCERTTRGSDGCFETRNYENITCPKKPECGYNERLVFVRMDETECCSIYECQCYSSCRVTIDGTVKLPDVGDEFIGESGCWQRCVNGSDTTDCPVPKDICQKPTECADCQFVAQTVKDTCGCDQYDCQTIKRCDSIKCSFPNVRKVNESADICKAPCYYCECDECWDQYQNRTYPIGKNYTRRELSPAKCFDCVCTSAMDDDGCPKEVCNPRPCKAIDACPSPYDTPVIGKDDCGCDKLLSCECDHCMFNGAVLDGRSPGKTWTTGDLALGCYDTYQCLEYKTSGMEKECFNVTKSRKACKTVTECKEGFILVDDESQSCYYEDGEYCAKKKCICDKCRFDGKYHEVGHNWTKDCIDYSCTGKRDPSDPDQCYAITSKVQDCPSTDLNCVNCYVQNLTQRRDVPDHCCDVWECVPALFCENDSGERVTNGSIWEPKECLRVQCIVSKEDWAKGICPDVVPIDHCDPDHTVCGDCQNKTIVKDECGCDKVKCIDHPDPVSCTAPAENQIIDYFTTSDSCFPSKNCCFCDNACFYNGVRQELFSVWWDKSDKSACRRLRCVLPAPTLAELGYDPKKINFDDLDDITTWAEMATKLNYRKMLSNTKLAQSLYSDCSQALSLCPETYDLGCPKPIECGPCENTTLSSDACGCPVITCAPLNPPKSCNKPGENQRITTLETGDSCFPSKNCCVCDSTCTYKGVTRQLFDVWQDEETCTRMRCVLPEATMRKLGYTGRISYSEVDNKEIEASLIEMKSIVDYRRMIKESNVARELYNECQQDISLCPAAIDIGCKPVQNCSTCYNAVITKDTCGCDVAECVKVEKCDINLTCPPGHLRYEIEDADPCKAPCFACKCDWCYDNFDNTTKPVGRTWKRTYTEPVRKCEMCNCTNQLDNGDMCKKEVCTPIPCKEPDTCAEPYNKASYDFDECGCKFLVSCECTQCMFNGEVVPNRSPGERWIEGDEKLGCYASYYCDPAKVPDKPLECFNVTKLVPDCPTDPECQGHQVAVKNENRSCCFEDKCCPRYDCDCVKCRMGDGSFKNPGAKWTENCIDYTCTEDVDPYDPQKCKLITSSPYQCNTTKPTCSDCRYQYLKTPISIPDQCCEVWDCMPEKVCFKDDGSKAQVGETWEPAPCKRLKCAVTDEDWANGMCPDWVPIDHCDKDLTVCPKCTNKTIVKDECNCDKTECPPNNPPNMCSTPLLNQVIDYFTTEDECAPSKNCCVCDNACTYNGERKELLSVWWDKSTCQRMRCVLPAATLTALGMDADTDFTDIDDTDTSRKILNSLNYRSMLTKTGIAKSLYSECVQDPALCPVAREIFCPKPQECGECDITSQTLDACGCPVVTCTPRTEPTSCEVAGENQVITSMETGDSCFPARNCCVCQSTCTFEGSEYQLYETWPGEKTCQRYRCVLPDSTVTALGFESGLDINDLTTSDIQLKFSQIKGKINFRTLLSNARIPQTLTGDCVQDSTMCPTVHEMPCEEPEECKTCHTRTLIKDECGCDVANCTKIKPCDPITCAFPYRATEIEDADVCKRPCYECTCNHACVDDLTNSTYEPEEKWQRTVPEPRKCQSCVCTNDIDLDGCLKESCVDNPCPAVANCSAPYDRAEYGTDECGCKVLIRCECTTCMYNGEILKGRTRGEKWTVGDYERGCYDDYYCEVNKVVGKEDECYNVTRTPAPCPVNTPCPDNHVAVKDEEGSCCLGDRCCPKYTCECVVCEMDGVTHTPGEKWSKHCIDYVCTNTTNEADLKKCKTITESPTQCTDTRENCTDCYVEYLKTPIDKSVEQCCNDYGCKPEMVCIKDDKTRVANGTIWWPDSCTRLQCFVSPEDWAKGVCPTPINLDPCLNDLDEPCPSCTNKTIGKDKCNCDIVECKPLDKPVECTTAQPFQIFTTLATEDICFPSKNCCVCDNTCYYKGVKKELFSVWMDGCTRSMCTPPNSLLSQLGYDPTTIDFKDIENVAFWNEIRLKINYRQLLQDSKIASKIYETCSQDPALCPTARDIGCPIPDPCPACTKAVTTNNTCGCPVVTCEPIKCDVAESSDCTPPKTVMKTDSSVTGDVCCPSYCECPQNCSEIETGKSYDRNIDWPHPTDKCYTRKCVVDPAKNEGCPYITNKTICTEPAKCDECYTGVETRDDCNCLVRTCKKNACPTKTCEDECEERYDTGDQDSCGCTIYGCRPKPCPEKINSCEDPEKDVYSWMDRTVDKCCKQQGCRCNYTKCVERTCPTGQVAIRNVSAVKCCCPEYICVPNDDSAFCTDYNGLPRKIGEPWINKDNHCKMLHCTYASAKKSSYRIEEYDRFTCFSEKPVCSNGGTAYLASTKEGCCREWVCPCTCQVYGDPHFTTFDGFSYDYQGKCTYTLMKEYAFNETEIIVDNELCKWQSARMKSLSCLKTMTVVHKGVNYTFTFGLKFLRNGVEIGARSVYNSPDKEVTVREFGYKQLKLQIHSLGLEIVYKTRLWMQSLILTVPYESYEGRMFGLCGSCNNDIADDFRDKNFNLRTIASETDQENIDKFGEGWITRTTDYDEPNCFPVEPDCPTPDVYPDCGELPADECIDCNNKCHLSHSKCHSCESDPCQVLRTDPVFKEANTYIDPRIHMAKCAYDLSLEANITRKCDPCSSASVAQYAALSELQGICIPWRTALNCDEVECPHPSQEYRECDLDAKRDLSCDNPILNVTASVNVEGCFCPEGTIRRSAASEECIPMKCCHGCSEAPTCQDGSVALAGEDTDDCGCPIYMCSDVEGCIVQQTEQLLEINIEGRMCRSAETVTTSTCAGNCAVSTTSVNGVIEASCSRCNPVSTATSSVSLTCDDGTTEEYEYDTITDCACADCSTCNGGSATKEVEPMA